MMKLQLTDKQNIFFCSDPHYNHKSIVKGTTEWKASSMCRNFSTLEEHNERLISNINETVGLNDILFCNGDWNFGSYSNKEFRPFSFKEVDELLFNKDVVSFDHHN